jgi:Ca2+-binding RTX toxin-like protein
MTESDSHLFKLTSLLFNAALGNDYYQQFSPVLAEVGIDTLAREWGASDVAQSVLGSTPEEQARNLVLNVGLNPDSTDSSSGDYIAYQFFLSSLSSGMNVGTLALAAIRYLEQDDILPSLETTRSFVQNRAEAAYQYSKELEFGGTDITSLQSVLESVTEDDSSINVTLAQASNSVFDQVRASSTLVSYSGDDDIIEGSDSSDYIDAGSGYDSVDGAAGADIILGGSGDDTLNGGRGQDFIEGGDGADYITAGSYFDREYIYGYYDDSNNYVSSYYQYTIDAYYETLDGGSGADTIYGGYGSDAISGGEGSDKLYGDYRSLASYELDYLDDSTITRLMNDTISGGTGADTIYGRAGDDLIYGDEGDDDVEAGTGDDTIYGGLGNDTLEGNEGSDVIYGEDGDDYIRLMNSYSAEEGEFNTAFGGTGNDTIYATAGDEVDAGEGDDYLVFYRTTDNSASAVLIAGEGSDEIHVNYYSYSKASSLLTIDLTETTAASDSIELDLPSRVTSAVEIQGFDIEQDTLDLDSYVQAYGTSNSFNDMKSYYYSGELRYDNVQIVSDTETEWETRSDSPSQPDEYGKGYFVIQGSTAASSSIDDVAALLDDYGNNASYGNKAQHIFLVNVSETDMGIYLFTDDTGANDRLLADELTPLAILTGVTTEDLTQTNTDFIIG